MATVSYEFNPELEQRIARELSPSIADVYDRHMTTGLRKPRGDEVNSPIEVGTIEPLTDVYRAAQLKPQEVITVELVEAVRTSYDEHIKKLESLHIDPKPIIQIAGAMNLATEDNLPWYTAEQFALYKDHPAFLELLSRWTTEEADHAPFIRKWAELSGAISIKKAHAKKVALLMGGISVDTSSFVALNAFTEPQEGDTAEAHRNYGRILDPIGRRVMFKTEGHELRHEKVFGEIGDEIYELDQEIIEYALQVEAATHANFDMPAAGSYPNYKTDSMAIAVSGLFTFETIIERQRKRIERLGLLGRRVTTPEAQRALVVLEDIVDPDSRSLRTAKNYTERATDRYIRQEKEAGRIPFILGRTVIFNKKGELEIYPEAA